MLVHTSSALVASHMLSVKHYKVAEHAMLVRSFLFCLIAGITYKYLGLRIFAHPWDGGGEVNFMQLKLLILLVVRAACTVNLLCSSALHPFVRCVQ
jgi:hypothetical protein